jgi:hypothetical protein
MTLRGSAHRVSGGFVLTGRLRAARMEENGHTVISGEAILTKL